MKVIYENASHYIDRQFGGVLYISTDENGKITVVDDEPDYKGNLEKQLIGLTIEEANAFLKKQFEGIFMYIKPM